jgi:hypothetical protein
VVSAMFCTVLEIRLASAACPDSAINRCDVWSVDGLCGARG